MATPHRSQRGEIPILRNPPNDDQDAGVRPVPIMQDLFPTVIILLLMGMVMALLSCILTTLPAMEEEGELSMSLPSNQVVSCHPHPSHHQALHPPLVAHTPTWSLVPTTALGMIMIQCPHCLLWEDPLQPQVFVVTTTSIRIIILPRIIRARVRTIGRLLLHLIIIIIIVAAIIVITRTATMKLMILHVVQTHNKIPPLPQPMCPRHFP